MNDSFRNSCDVFVHVNIFQYFAQSKTWAYSYLLYIKESIWNWSLIWNCEISPLGVSSYFQNPNKNRNCKISPIGASSYFQNPNANSNCKISPLGVSSYFRSPPCRESGALTSSGPAYALTNKISNFRLQSFLLCLRPNNWIWLLGMDTFDFLALFKLWRETTHYCLKVLTGILNSSLNF